MGDRKNSKADHKRIETPSFVCAAFFFFSVVPWLAVPLAISAISMVCKLVFTAYCHIECILFMVLSPFYKDQFYFCGYWKVINGSSVYVRIETV